MCPKRPAARERVSSPSEQWGVCILPGTWAPALLDVHSGQWLFSASSTTRLLAIHQPRQHPESPTHTSQANTQTHHRGQWWRRGCLIVLLKLAVDVRHPVQDQPPIRGPHQSHGTHSAPHAGRGDPGRIEQGCQTLLVTAFGNLPPSHPTLMSVKGP